LIVASGNPLNITGLGDLVRPDVRFINRQREAGTRVWLDVQLRNLGLESAQIAGYTTEAHTHIELASAIYENLADVGLGIEAAALAYGLDFILLTTERYDLIIPGEEWERETIHAMIAMLQTGEMKKAIDLLGGYETSHTGTVEWVD
jgi:putative molybdopterin biosynthesis protein